MKYLSIVLTAMISLFFTQIVVDQSNSEASEIKTDTLSALFSKKQIEEKLEKLVDSFSQIHLAYMGCMCRFIHPISYICPKCDKTTLYESHKKEWLMDFGREKYVWNNRGYFEPDPVGFDDQAYDYIAYKSWLYKQEVQKIKGIHVALDESEFCKYCSPFITKPTLYLLTNIEGEPDTTKVPNISYSDIHLIDDFLNDRFVYVYKSKNNSITAIDDSRALLSEAIERYKHIERIKELLGIKNEPIEKEN